MAPLSDCTLFAVGVICLPQLQPCLKIIGIIFVNLLIIILTPIFQKRQVKTNVCQALFPLVLLLLLFVLQILVASIIRDTYGEFAPAVESPSIQPKFTILPTNLTDVQKDCGKAGNRGLPIENDDTRILFTGGGDVGRFPNVTIEELIAANNNLIPYLSELLQFNSSGLLNRIVNAGGMIDYLAASFNISTGTFALPPGLSAGQIAAFQLQAAYPLGFKGLFIPTQGSRVDVCYSEPWVFEPRFEPISDKAAIDERLLKSWAHKAHLAAIDFQDVDFLAKTLKYSIFYNRSMTQGSDVPIYINMLTGSFWRNIVSRTGEYLWAGFKGYPTPRSRITFDLISIIGPQIYVFIFQLLFPVFLASLVFEKENRLREIMRMMGLKTEIYWLVQYIFFLILYIIATGLLYAIAAALGFNYYTKSAGVLVVFLLVWGNTMIAFAFLLSVFIGKARSATVIGYLILILTGLLAQTIIQPILTEESTSDATKIGLSVIPQFALFRGLLAFRFAVAFDGPGMTFSNLRDYKLDQVLIALAIEWAVFMILAIYFELVLPLGPGVKKHPLFFLPKRLWHTQPAPPATVEEPEDVAKERRDTLDNNPDAVLRVLDIHKVYPGGCMGQDKVAVHNLTMHINKGECFGFLGPNGAGKSTTINMLSGYLRPTGGTATINGLDIKEDLDLVRLELGVCPQDNILWDDLTGPEHLYFYGRLKNLRGKELDDAVVYWLEQVNLTNAKTKFSRQYSGGMKRRLSVAIAMIGDPDIVLLDEPTTGLDPASKQSLWDVVIRYKRQCSMMLTTHSMEEAEALCDRLGIFIGGRLATTGTAQDLKARYGSGYRLVMTTPMADEEKARQFIQKLIPKAKLMNTLAGTQNFEVPRGAIKLSRAFTEIEAKRKTYNIVDWGISNTTLEEVFLYITDRVGEEDVGAALMQMQAELKAAEVEAQRDEDKELVEDSFSSSSSSDEVKKKKKKSPSKKSLTSSKKKSKRDGKEQL